MLEMLAVIVLLLAAFSILIILPLLLVIKAVQATFGTVVKEVFGDEEVQEHNWRRANAFERERMVRKSCGWRVIGRFAGAGALVTGVFVASSPALGVVCCMAAWRMLKPIKQEMRDACAYKSTGADDEPRC
jgi:hypothetical protein